MPGIETPAIVILNRFAGGAVQAACFIKRKRLGPPDDQSDCFAQPIARDHLIEVGQGMRLVGRKVGLIEVEARQFVSLIIGPDATPADVLGRDIKVVPDPVAV
jgi:hypothetical protein